MRHELTPHRSDVGMLASVALAKLALHLAVSARYGYSIDELYFLACGEGPLCPQRFDAAQRSHVLDQDVDGATGRCGARQRVADGTVHHRRELSGERAGGVVLGVRSGVARERLRHL